MAEKTDSNIVNEVEQRLEDLFGDENEEVEAAEEGADAEPALSMEQEGAVEEEVPALEEADGEDIEDSPLKELKSIVLSIEWEITDTIMSKFLDQVNQLSAYYKNEKIVLMFLQLLGTVGRYIKAKKESSDPDVVKLLNTAYAGLEKVLLKKDLSNTEKKKILAAEVNRFKVIKQRITGKTVPQKRETEAKVSLKTATPVTEISEHPPEPGAEQKTAPAPEVLSSEQASDAQTPYRRRGMGFGSKVSLVTFLPLVVIAAAIYIYESRLTHAPSLVDHWLQALTGLFGENLDSLVLAAMCGLIVFFALITYLICRRLAKKINALIIVVERIRNGDESVPITINAKGELGVLVDAIRRLRDSKN